MKTFGWRGHYAKGGNSRQGRYIMAASSVAAVLRATGMTRYQFNLEGCETGNDGEIAKANEKPGTIFVRGLDDREGDPWEEVRRDELLT